MTPRHPPSAALRRDALAGMAACLLVSGTAWAQVPAATAATASTASIADAAEGEVRRIDREARKITLRHGDIRNLSMPPMTMVFQVAEPGLLDRVKVGDKVRFRAEQKDGAYRVTDLQPAP